MRSSTSSIHRPLLRLPLPPVEVVPDGPGELLGAPPICPDAGIGEEGAEEVGQVGLLVPVLVPSAAAAAPGAGAGAGATGPVELLDPPGAGLQEDGEEGAGGGSRPPLHPGLLRPPAVEAAEGREAGQPLARRQGSRGRRGPGLGLDG